jgi:hypothetical protein
VQVCATGSERFAPCGLNGRGKKKKTCLGGAWQSAWGNCVDPDVCVDGAVKEGLSCAPDPGYHSDTCVAGQWSTNDDCGSCSGTFKDPCLQNMTKDACFAASYDGFTCAGWWSDAPHCRGGAFLPTHCSTIVNHSACRPIFDCTWTSY